MKIYVILLSMVLGTVQAQQQKPAGFHIEGRIKGISEKSFVSITDRREQADGYFGEGICERWNVRTKRSRK